MRLPFVHEMFQRAALAHPDRAAILSGQQELSYRQLDLWSNQLGNDLLDRGARKGALVYVAAANTPSAVASMLATLKIGAVFVPVDLQQPAARIRALTAQVAPAFVLAAEPLRAAVHEKVGRSDVPVVGIELSAARGSEQSPPGVSEPEDMCYVYFTSGSTGRPKAIAGRLKSIDHFVRWEMEALAVGPGTRVSQLTSFVFDAFLRDTFTALCAGGTMCVPESRETVLDPRRLVAWLDGTRIEIVHAVPSLFRTILAEPLRPDLFPALRHVALAGEPLLPSDVQRWTQVFGDRVRLVNLYGPTETTMVKLFHRVRPEDGVRRSVPIGRAMPGASVLVLDDAGGPAEQGTVGEIYIKTDFATLGYFNNPELTEQVFVPNPLGDEPDDIVYRTGDLGRVLEDGSLEFIGRRDQQVKIRGVRVELGEIESAILATGLVKEVAAVGRADRQGSAFLCAYLVPSEEGSIEKVRQAISASLPDHLVPSAFVELDWLPRTATGKIDRKSLPAPEQTSSNVDPISPRNRAEADAARIFAEVLGRDSIGVNEDFFRMGGHSLLAMSLLARLSTHFEVELPLATLFEFPAVEQVVRVIEERRRAEPANDGAQPLQPGAPGGATDKGNQMTDADVDSLLADVLSAKAAG